jgi:hypothetical protein
MKSRIIPFLLFCLTLLSFCTNPVSESRTPEKDFYYEIHANSEDPFTQELSLYLTEQIPKKKYTFTNRSSQFWPYYEAIPLDSTLPADSLMPPHWYLHVMIPKEKDSDLKMGDHLVKIDLVANADTPGSYEVKVFEQDSTGLTLTGTSGVHFVDTASFKGKEETFEHYLKSIIRYSFK